MNKPCACHICRIGLQCAKEAARKLNALASEVKKGVLS